MLPTAVSQHEGSGGVSAGGEKRTRTAVVGYDGSDEAKAALAVAVELLKEAPAGKVVITCGQDRPPAWTGYTYRGPVPARDELMDEIETQIVNDLEEAAGAARGAGVEAATACTRDHPVDTLLKVAADVGADMIVVGARGAGALQDVVMGSTTMRLLHVSKIPVLVVPTKK
jgi:nucleotide-binding universal stress UspA family protein